MARGGLALELRNAAHKVVKTGQPERKTGIELTYHGKLYYVGFEITTLNSASMIYAGNKEKQQITGEIKITTGLEFLKDVCIDTHFIDRSRFIRMAQVLASNPTSIGIGIEEDTAIVVREGLNAEVIGKGVVTIIEGFSITSTNITEFFEDKPISIQDMNVHLLPDGNVYRIPQTNPPHK